jgi:hypothetical protein
LPKDIADAQCQWYFWSNNGEVDLRAFRKVGEFGERTRPNWYALSIGKHARISWGGIEPFNTLTLRQFPYQGMLACP